jgi:putative PIN family toxin of toxin-antitoxin system
MALARKVRLFISDAIIDDVLEVLETKFNHSPKRLALEKEYIGKCTVRCMPKVRLDVVKDDPDDNRILECAVHSRSEAIITHDKDLLRMKSYHGIAMMKVNEFLREERGLSR